MVAALSIRESVHGTSAAWWASGRKLSLAFVTIPFWIACTCSKLSRTAEKGFDPSVLSNAFVLDQVTARTDLSEIAGKAHPFGSPRQKELGDWLLRRIESIGGAAFEFKFTADTPNPELLLNPNAPADLIILKTGRNIVAIHKSPGLSDRCLVFFGSHYDSKIIAGSEYLGANDSGSSALLLLQILTYVQNKAVASGLECGVAMIWFDGEEAVLPDWRDGELIHPAKIRDNTYGSRDFAASLSDCEFNGSKARCVDLSGIKIPVIGLILLDMVGSPKIKINLESNSTASLRQLLVDAAAATGTSELLVQSLQPIEDDHIPFLKSGVPALDIIDFSHLEYWHKDGDQASEISMESIEIAGKLSIFVALSLASSPKAVLNPSDP